MSADRTIAVATPTLSERLFSKVRVNAETGCWEWTAYLQPTGYATIRLGGKDTPAVGSHRVAYELLVGPIPDGMELDHLCRVRHCVNPAHLEPVTTRENVLRGESFSAANARKTHCKRGHPFAGKNLRFDPRGDRVCRTCKRELQRERLAARRAA